MQQIHYRKQENNFTKQIVMRYTIARANFRTFLQRDQNFRTTLNFRTNLKFQEFQDNWDPGV